MCGSGQRSGDGAEGGESSGLRSWWLGISGEDQSILQSLVLLERISASERVCANSVLGPTVTDCSCHSIGRTSELESWLSS